MRTGPDVRGGASRTGGYSSPTKFSTSTWLSFSCCCVQYSLVSEDSCGVTRRGEYQLIRLDGNFFTDTESFFFFIFFFIFFVSSINGVKEMQGFRETFNISFTQEALGGLNVTEGVQCGSEDDVETSALLVQCQSALH